MSASVEASIGTLRNEHTPHAIEKNISHNTVTFTHLGDERIIAMQAVTVCCHLPMPATIRIWLRIERRRLGDTEPTGEFCERTATYG